MTRTVTDLEDTIAAIATPPGTAGIAVVRISGSEALHCAADVFDGRTDPRNAPSHTLHHGFVRAADGSRLDEVVLALYRAPHSYTGEDCTEFFCHGGVMVSRAVLDRVLEAGARHALPGEFTRRAFLNGRMDLAQAEAVADLIHAQSAAALRASMRQLDGRLSQPVRGLREQLIRCASLLELGLDFAEEGIEAYSTDEMRHDLDDIRDRIAALLATFDGGRVIREGLKVVITGPPNAGKSSLLNALLGMERAIVTDTPGTTRDYIEEAVRLEGTLVRLVDTAGLRPAADEVEREGIARAGEQLREADLICLVVDAADGDTDDRSVASLVRAIASLGGKEERIVVLANKCDLPPRGTLRELDPIAVSARTGEGIPRLVERIAAEARARTAPTEGAETLVTNARHAECLRRAHAALERARRAWHEGLTEECIAADVRSAADAVGEIIGAVTTEDVLNAIFSRFCIGK
ncbi:MAG: tRNA uridine-5-carboxymethylaminomethyl(34) synthesis GTPase MnmE [Bacteroidota bacterium]|nr:tRNA uridine-5-carboxymethylaminomethyl(34) synthesis GTPase MnmE [Bacteroidota bacterium]